MSNLNSKPRKTVRVLKPILICYINHYIFKLKFLKLKLSSKLNPARRNKAIKREKREKLDTISGEKLN